MSGQMKLVVPAVLKVPVFFLMIFHYHRMEVSGIKRIITYHA